MTFLDACMIAGIAIFFTFISQLAIELILEKIGVYLTAFQENVLYFVLAFLWWAVWSISWLWWSSNA